MKGNFSILTIETTADDARFLTKLNAMPEIAWDKKLCSALC